MTESAEIIKDTYNHSDEKMTKCYVGDNLARVVILDISGVYAQIHNQGYFERISVPDIVNQYSDAARWRIVVLDD